MTDQQGRVLEALRRAGAVTLAQITEETGLDYYEAWAALTGLRRRALVAPGIRHGQRGRWRGGPVVYRAAVRPLGAVTRSRRRPERLEASVRRRGRGGRRLGRGLPG